MFKVTGKQRFGAVYRNGKEIVNFRNGVGYTDNPYDAEHLKKKGFTVEGNPPAPVDPLAELSAKDLMAYATDHGIDLTDVPNRKEKILAAIRAVEPWPTEDQGGE